MSNIENVLILSGITIMSGISLWMLNNEKTPKKRSPTKNKRSPTPKRSPSPIKEDEIKTPLPTIRKSSPKVMSPKVKTVVDTPKVKTVVRSPKVMSPKVKTVVELPKVKSVRSPKIIAPIKRRVSPKRRSPSEPRVQFISRSPSRSPPRSPPRSPSTSISSRSSSKSILKRRSPKYTRRRKHSDSSISSTNATIHTEATERDKNP